MIRRWSLFAAQNQGTVASVYIKRFRANFASASAEEVIHADGRRNFSYETFAAKIAVARTQRDSPLTLTEKILYGHLEEPENADLVEGSPLKLRPDVVAVQGEAIKGVLKKFEDAGLRETAVPALLHCDRTLEADDALARRAAQHGIQLVKPSSGSTHQVLLDKYAAPGHLLVGLNTGSLSPGGLGLLVGARESEVFELFAGRSLEMRVPKVVGVMLKGELEGWSSPEDIGFELLEQLGSEGGSGAVLEYFGEGVEELSATSMASVGRVGDEVGSMGSVFPYNDSVRDYLYATGRNDKSTQADCHIDLLTADKGVRYEELVKIDLSQVKARVSGGLWENGRPAVWPLHELSSALRQHGFPDRLSGGLIGGSFEELSRAASVARQVLKLGLKAMIPFCIVPASPEIAEAMKSEGLTKTFEDVGGTVLPGGCELSVATWRREHSSVGSSVISSHNLELPPLDADDTTPHFTASPEITTVMTLVGSLHFNPESDLLAGDDSDGNLIKPPTGAEFPKTGLPTVE